MDYETIEREGIILDSTAEGTVHLWVLDGIEWVILADNTVISRDEDNSTPEGAFFPY